MGLMAVPAVAVVAVCVPIRIVFDSELLEQARVAHVMLLVPPSLRFAQQKSRVRHSDLLGNGTMLVGREQY